MLEITDILLFIFGIIIGLYLGLRSRDITYNDMSSTGFINDLLKIWYYEKRSNEDSWSTKEQKAL